MEDYSQMLDPWVKPSTTNPLSTLLGLTDNKFTVEHSPIGTTSGDYLPTRVSLSTKNVVSVLLPVTTPLTTTNWKTTLNTSTGTFTGSFELRDPPNKRPVTFSGVLRQPASAPDPLIGNGHYLMPPLGGTGKIAGEILYRRP